MVTVAAMTLLVKVVATGKDVAVANAFGTASVMDAFLIAFLLPSYAITVVAGAVPAAFIPVYIKVRAREGAQAAGSLLSTVLLAGAAGLLGVTIILAGLGRQVLPLLGGGFDSATLQVTTALFLLLLPGILLQGVATIAAAALNATDRYLLASTVPVVTPLAITVALLSDVSRGILALVVGTLIGMLIEATLLVGALHKRDLLGRPQVMNPHPALREVGAQYLPAVVGSAVMSGASLIDMAMAGSLTAGSVSVLSFGSKLVMGVLGIGVLALATPILPLFSRHVEAREWNALGSTIRWFVTVVVSVVVPMTLILIWFSEDLVRLLFERGAFDAGDTRIVARVQVMYLLQAPFYVLGVMGVRLLSALGRNALVMWVSVLNLVSNALGNLLLMRVMGVAGIALSTSIVYFISCMVIFALVRSSLRRLQMAPVPL
ncbi:MAG: polysaccharide biosynthesis C-terminal domain-containing protein [Gemmatimonadetes bacterium]|nr:polysaccharide biosynthesis C-terminal domain-containing protein [Gemmatimonadota bacterium]